MKKIEKFIRNPLLLFESLGHRGLFNWMNDDMYLKILFRIRLGRQLDLNKPQAFNDKLQWIKIYDRNADYTDLVDKYKVKNIISKKIGSEYIIPTLGVWEKFEDIDFNRLPNQFVLKCTHDSGGLVICKDKAKLDIEKTKRKITKCLKHNFYYGGREWPYKNVRPRIIAEKYMQDKESADLTDYKLMVFNGVVKCIFTCTKRYSEKGTHVTFFDTEWNRLPFGRHYPIDNDEIKKPETLATMIELAEKIAEDLKFARIDFYEINQHPYFGEVTFFPGDGFEEFYPEEWDYIIGSWLEL